MILKTLWVQRKCSYEGEHAPECLVAVDEYCYDDNPGYFNDRAEDELNQVKPYIISHKIINIEVDQEQIAKLLNDNPNIRGEIR